MIWLVRDVLVFHSKGGDERLFDHTEVVNRFMCIIQKIGDFECYTGTGVS